MSSPDIALTPLPRAFVGATRTCFAPAKINLALHVMGRRDDGYHDLDGLILPLAWGDTLVLSLHEADAPEVECICENQPVLSGSRNLAARAAWSWLRARRLRARVTIRLTKRIWVAAGLGGGSSDAAATLRGLDALVPLQKGAGGASSSTLALALGADVPFFLEPRPARAQGIGDVLTPLRGRGPEPLGIVLVNPGRSLATPEIFAALGLARGERLRDACRPAPELPDVLPTSVPGLAALIHNDLEVTATRLCPEIADLRAALVTAGALAVGLTGSGPTVFGFFGYPSSAARAAATIPTIYGFLSVSTALAVA
ncbi:MAG: 4-(cytidine 5'-diphospho)-2-C-methyl-D-erythritol kinase [Deltaproteobacteria bacterium]|nr:4-(cytidine 5'-diphospho)-2-C-methyl-D-erythritol kinase [Deltaproteobacteria bacterium]